MRFVAIDVETANANLASICSIGAATFVDGRLASEWYSLVDPRDFFSHAHVAIHKIDAAAVRGQPSFGEISPVLQSLVRDTVVVTHSGFDRVAMRQAARRDGVEPLECAWLDSMLAVRRTWDECARRGYGLKAVCERIGHEFLHHNALEDAKAAGYVLLATLADSGLELREMMQRLESRRSSRRPRRSGSSPRVYKTASIRQDGNPDGEHFGEVVVFTGALCMLRRQAAEAAAAAGCRILPNMTKEVTMLVVGDVDARQPAGHKKSSKHRQAESMMAAGAPLRILRETDFLALIGLP